VLPLANLSGSEDQEYFSDGMTESLITDLARIGALKVISRTSVMRYKGTNKRVREIGKELGVDALLEGSALRSGNRIRITAKLIEAQSEQPLWADSYNREFADVLLVLGEMARTVAQQVRVRLNPEERARLAVPQPVHPEAHQAYLQGMYQWYRQEYDDAQRLFELSLAKAPKNARSYAGIARVWTARTRQGMSPPREGTPKAMVALQKALALDNTLAEVHTALATSQMLSEWDWNGAEAEFQRAIDLDPNDAEARTMYAGLLNVLNRPAEATMQMERALELDPYNPMIRGNYAFNLSFSFRYAEAEAEARRALASNPRLRPAMAALRTALLRQGKIKEVLEVHRDNLAKRGLRDLAAVLQHGYEKGRYREAFAEAAQLLESRFDKGAFVQVGDIAALWDEAGRPDKCLDWWEKAVERREAPIGGILLMLPQGSVRPNNPRLQAIFRRAGLPNGPNTPPSR